MVTWVLSGVAGWETSAVTIEQVIDQYALPVRSVGEAAEFGRGAAQRLGRALPVAAARYARAPRLAHELARAYTAQVAFPDQVEPAVAELGPGLGPEHLWLMTENQGVCVWAVPLDVGESLSEFSCKPAAESSAHLGLFLNTITSAGARGRFPPMY